MPRSESITTTEDCSLCGGTLQVGPRIADQTVGPCVACLSVPIEGREGMPLREFAREWLGFDPWDGDLGDTPWSQEYVCPDGIATGRNDCLPLYLPAGFDLGVRWLASRYGMDTAAGAIWRPCRLTVPAEVGVRPEPAWALNHIDPNLADDWHKARRVFVNHPAPENMAAFQAWTHVPALASIPDDAPSFLRAARALKLCLEVTP